MPHEKSAQDICNDIGQAIHDPGNMAIDTQWEVAGKMVHICFEQFVHMIERGKTLEEILSFTKELAKKINER